MSDAAMHGEVPRVWKLSLSTGNDKLMVLSSWEEKGLPRDDMKAVCISLARHLGWILGASSKRGCEEKLKNAFLDGFSKSYSFYAAWGKVPAGIPLMTGQVFYAFDDGDVRCDAMSDVHMDDGSAVTASDYSLFMTEIILVLSGAAFRDDAVGRTFFSADIQEAFSEGLEEGMAERDSREVSP